MQLPKSSKLVLRIDIYFITFLLSISLPALVSQTGAAEKGPSSKKIKSKKPDRPWLNHDSLSESRLRASVKEFNQSQNNKCEQSDSPNVCENFPEVELSDVNGFIELRERNVIERHSSGIDGGVDTTTTYLFKKGSALKKVAVVEGQLHRLEGDRFAVSVDGKDGCLGYVPTGTFQIHDLRINKVTFEHDFSQNNEQIISYQLEPLKDSQPHFRLSTDSESPIPNRSSTEEKACEVGELVLKTHRTLDVRCNTDGLGCKVSEVSNSKKVECQNIGGCD